MRNHTKQNRPATARGPRIDTPGSDLTGRSGSARRAGAGLASRRVRIPLAPMPVPDAGPRSSANPYEAFYALSAESIGLLDPGFDVWDQDPYVLTGLSPRLGFRREDT